jgi:hypothetical protein
MACLQFYGSKAVASYRTPKNAINQQMSDMNPKNKPNGHGALLARSGANGGTISSSGTGRAASVDASDLSVANATASSAAAGAEREAYADVAQVEGEGEQLVTATAASQSPKKSGRGARQASTEVTGAAKPLRRIPPGREPLPVDGEAFVDAVHAKVDLVRLEVALLRSKDAKIRQRELAYLRELRYGKRAEPADGEPTQIIFDMPGPERENQ